MTGVLHNGQSEIDTVVLALPDYQREISNWSRYSYHQAFLTPVAGWSFSVSDEDPTLTNELLVPGARVQLRVANNPQCTGYIERKSISSDAAGGTVVTVQGRDILGPVVDATQLEQDLSHVAIGQSEGAKLALGGERLNRATPGC